MHTARTHQTIALHSIQAQPRLPTQKQPDLMTSSEHASALIRKGGDNVGSSPNRIFDKQKVMKLLAPSKTPT